MERTIDMGNRILSFLFGLALAAAAAGGVYLTACSGGGGSPRGPNVLLVVVDTLRADRLGCLGNDLGMTPGMDAFAKEGVLFRHAYSHAPWTLPSFASMLTSLYPEQHGAGGWLGAFTRLDGDVTTLGECFQKAGYKTAAVVNVDWLHGKFGMGRGFGKVDYVPNRGNHLTRIARGTTNSALKWIDRLKGGPFFLMVHYFDPHLVYEPPPAFRKAFALDEDKDGRDTIFGEVPEIVRHGLKQMPELDAATVRRLEGLYDGEVAYTDSELTRLLAGLSSMGLDKSTVVVITADHGEEFLDHGGFEHGHTLYDELIHIPLMVRWTGRIPAGKVVDTVVRHVDIAPTLCRLTGVAPGEDFEGKDLAPLWESEAPGADRPVFSEGNFWGRNPLFARRDGGYKTIMHLDTRTVEIYDMNEDPGERHNLAPKRPDLARRLAGDLTLVRRKMADDAARAAPVDLSPEERERLRQLGYIR